MRLRRGLRSTLLSTSTFFLQGEPAYTTDTKHLFIGNASYYPVPVQTLDMAVVDASGNVVTHASAIVFNF